MRRQRARYALLPAAAVYQWNGLALHLGNQPGEPALPALLSSRTPCKILMCTYCCLSALLNWVQRCLQMIGQITTQLAEARAINASAAEIAELSNGLTNWGKILDTYSNKCDHDRLCALNEIADASALL